MMKFFHWIAFGMVMAILLAFAIAWWALFVAAFVLDTNVFERYVPIRRLITFRVNEYVIDHCGAFLDWFHPNSNSGDKIP